MSKVRIGDLMQRRKELIRIEDDVTYKQVTIRTKHKGVVLRGTQKGAAIGTKNQYITYQDQFILSCIDARNGAFGIVPPELEGAIITNDFWCFDINEQLVLRDFFYTLIQAPDFDDACKKASIGTTNRQRINADFFLNYELELPPIEEQTNAVRQILAAQQHTDLIAAEITHQATLLTRMRQAILREAVEGHLVPQDHADEPAPALLVRIRAEKQRLVKEKKLRPEKPLPVLNEAHVPYEVPTGWTWSRLGEIVTKMDSGWSPACLNTPASANQWGVLKTTAVQEMEYRAFENKALPTSLKPREQYEVEAGDILITRAGPYNRVGVVCYVEASPKRLMISDKIIRFHCFSDFVNPQYIALCTQIGGSRSFIDSKKSGMAESQVNISQENLKLTPIPLPPLAEQGRIVTKVAELMANCIELEAELSRMRAAASALHAAALREVFQPVPAAVII